MADTGEYQSQKQVLADYPKLSASTLKSWVKICRPLGRGLATQPNPCNPRYQLYSVADVHAAVQGVRDDLPESFTENNVDWIWIQKCGRATPSLYRWAEADGDGCPALSGRKLSIKLFRSWDNLKGRDYVRVDEISSIKSFSPTGSDSSLPIGFSSYKDARKSFDRRFLIKFASKGSKAKPCIPRPHPALGKGGEDPGRPITIERYLKVVDGRRLRAIGYKTADLSRILECTVPTSLWASREQIHQHYRALGDTDVIIDSELAYAEKYGKIYTGNNGRLKSSRFPIPPSGRGKPTSIKYWWRADLDKLIKSVAERKELPQIVKGERDTRVYINEADGHRYYPRHEAMILAGITSIRSKVEFDEWLVSCPHLGGDPLRSLHVDGKLFGSKHDGYRVYLLEDLNKIYRSLHKTKKGRSRIPTGTAKGRSRKYDQAEVETEWVRWKNWAAGHQGGLKGYSEKFGKDPNLLRSMFNTRK